MNAEIIICRRLAYEFYQAGVLSIWKHTIKSLVLFIVFSVLAALVYVGICIPAAANLEVDRAKATVGSEVTISLDAKKANIEADKDPNAVKPLSTAALDSLSKLGHLKSYNYTVSNTNVVSDGADMIGNEDLRQQQQESLPHGMIASNMTVYGAQDVSKMDQFMSGGYSLYSGRFIAPADAGKPVVMISKGIADKNGLKLGGKFKIKWHSQGANGLEFTIVGIFTSPVINSIEAQYFSLNPADFVFIPYDQDGLISHLNNFKLLDNTCVYSALYFVDDPSNVAGFVKQAKAIIPGDYNVQSNDDLYQQAVAPLVNISKTTQLLQLIIICASCLIIALIIAIFLKGRNYECGTLLAIGEKRQRSSGKRCWRYSFPYA